MKVLERLQQLKDARLMRECLPLNGRCELNCSYWEVDHCGKVESQQGS